MAGVTTAAQAATDKVAQVHARMLAAHDLQFDFRAAEAHAPLRGTPPWVEALKRFFDGVAPFTQWIFWGGLAIGVLVILFFVGREFVYVRWPKFKPRPKVEAEPAWRPTESQARALLEEADRLAAEGLFAEAAHLILFRSIEDIQGRRPHVVRPALTTRDIAVHEGLPGGAREAFCGIAETVERSFFGGRPVDADSFAACRRAYEAFAFPGSWG
jgi:hypothetical protein